jgi:hypothetical protein
VSGRSYGIEYRSEGVGGVVRAGRRRAERSVGGGDSEESRAERDANHWRSRWTHASRVVCRRDRTSAVIKDLCSGGGATSDMLG